VVCEGGRTNESYWQRQGNWWSVEQIWMEKIEVGEENKTKLETMITEAKSTTVKEGWRCVPQRLCRGNHYEILKEQGVSSLDRQQ
jgi:hypothetical protein